MPREQTEKETARGEKCRERERRKEILVEEGEKNSLQKREREREREREKERDRVRERETLAGEKENLDDNHGGDGCQNVLVLLEARVTLQRLVVHNILLVLRRKSGNEERKPPKWMCKHGENGELEMQGKGRR